MKRIGIMGGTFDPIHFGHLVTAEKVQEAFSLDEVVFVPSGNPPHKKNRKVTEATHRLNMVKLAIADHPGFSVSPIEINRKGYSYALDTVDAFRRIYGEDTKLFFITGADAILEIATWHKADELMAKCQFIAAARPGYHFDEAHTLPKAYQDRIHIFRETALAISSSRIRRLIGDGADVSDMLPQKVNTYIETHNLYQKESYD
jgi:nicotinate-nucleotide adenylyltransferase